MAEASWPHLCFRSLSPDELLCATVLPFGLGQAPFVFHKLTRHMNAFAGMCGFRLMSYLDDCLWACEPKVAEITRTFAVNLIAQMLKLKTRAARGKI